MLYTLDIGVGEKVGIGKISNTKWLECHLYLDIDIGVK